MEVESDVPTFRMTCLSTTIAGKYNCKLISKDLRDAHKNKKSLFLRSLGFAGGRRFRIILAVAVAAAAAAAAAARVRLGVTGEKCEDAKLK